MKMLIKNTFVSRLWIMLENWIWDTVLMEQLGISPNEARRMMEMSGSPNDAKFGWASQLAYYKGYDHDHRAQ